VDAVASAVGHPAELLVVLVEEGTRVAGLVADRDPGRPVGIVQPTETGAPEGGVHGRAGMAGQRRQAMRAPATLDPGSDDRLRLVGRQRPRRASWSGAPIEQARIAFGSIPAKPLVRGRPADALHR